MPYLVMEANVQEIMGSWPTDWKNPQILAHVQAKVEKYLPHNDNYIEMERSSTRSRVGVGRAEEERSHF